MKNKISEFPIEIQNIIREYLVGDKPVNSKEYATEFNILNSNPNLKKWVKTCSGLLNKYYLNIYNCYVRIDSNENRVIYLIFVVDYRSRWYVNEFGNNKIYLMNEIFLELKNYSLDIKKIIRKLNRYKSSLSLI